MADNAPWELFKSSNEGPWSQFQGATPTPPAPPPSTERTAGEAFKDIGASALGGLGALTAAPGQLLGLVPGLRGAGEALAAPGEALSEKGESLKSAGLKAREALRNQALTDAEKDGVLSQFATAITSTLKDPALITSFVAEQVPLLIGPLGAARIATRLGAKGVETAGAGLTGEALQAARQAAAEKLGTTATRAAYGTGAAMQAADVSSDAYREALDLALKQGMSESDAQQAALNAARTAAVGAGGVSLLTQRLPGAQAIERRLAGLPGAGRIRSALGESVQETLEEGGGQFFKNLALQQVDPNQSLTAGLGTAAGLGALGGGVLGAALGRAPDAELAPGQRQGETLYQTAQRLNAEIAQLDALARMTEQDNERKELGLPTNAQLVDMYREQGYGAVKQYREQLASQVEAAPREQRAAITNAVKQLDEILRTVTAEEVQRRTTSRSEIILPENAVELGIDKQDPLFTQVVGKNLASPEDLRTITEAFNAEIQLPNVTPERVGQLQSIYNKINEYLTSVPGSGFYAEQLVQTPSGASPSVVGVPGAGAAPEGLAGTQRVGVATAEQPAPTAPVGEGTQPPSVTEAPTEAPTAPEVKREETVAPPVAPPVAEAPAAPAGTAAPAEEVEPPAPPPVVTPPEATELPEVEIPEPKKSNKELALSFQANNWGSTLGQLRQSANPIIASIGKMAQNLADVYLEVRPSIFRGKLKNAAAGYSPSQHAIYTRSKKWSGSEHAIAHEVAHALTHAAIKSPTEKQKPAIQRLDNLYQYVKKHLGADGKKRYGLTNLDEFVAEGNSNVEFQRELARIPYQRQTAWGAFTKAIADILGIKDSRALTELLAITEELGAPTQAKPSLKPETEARAAEIMRGRQAEPAKPAEPTKAEIAQQRNELIAGQRAALVKQLDGILNRILAKYGLKGVKLNLDEAFKDEGSYARQVITMALNLDNPVRVLRHESIHALKDMGFFSPQQWAALEKRANDEWIQTLKNTKHTETQSRYEAYVELYGQEGASKGLTGDALTKYVNEAVVEEAIADAFGAYEATKAPPGMMQAILFRMRNLFKAIKESFNLAGVESAEDIFGKIEKGALKPALPPAKVSAEEPAKPSLRQRIESGETRITVSRLDEGKGNELVSLDTAKADKAWKKGDVNDSFYIGKGGTGNTIRDRYQRFGEFAKTAKQIDAPLVSVNEKGEVSFGDGRHRFSYMRDEGFKSIPVAMDQESKANAIKAGLVSGEKPSLRPEVAAPTSAAFKRWSRDLPIIPANNTKAYKGGSAVFQVYHGTTHTNIVEFRSDVGSKEGSMGQGPYLSTSIEDVNENYAGVGPDLTSRIGREEESVADAFREDNYYASELLEEYFQDNNIEKEVTDENIDELSDEYGEKAVHHRATKNLKGESEGLVMPLWVRLQKPFDMRGTQGTQFYLEYPVDKNGETNLEADPTGTAVELIEAIQEIASQYNAERDVEDLIDFIYGEGLDGVSAKDVFDRAKKINHLYDENGETISAGQFIQEVARELKFDGMIQDAYSEFGPNRLMGIMRPGMKGLSQGTLHIMPFNTVQIKSQTGNIGTYEETGDIRRSLRTNTDTPQFKFWFRQSTIKDKSDAPKQMYHGTGKAYEKLGTARRQAAAIFVSDDPAFAEKFAKDTFARAAREAAQGIGIDDAAYKRGVNRAIEAIRKDYGRRPEGKEMIAGVRKGYNEANAEAQEYMRDAFKDELPAGPNIIPVYVRAENPFDYENPKHVEAIKNIVAPGGTTNDRVLARSLESGNWETIERDDVQKAIRDLGFDGFWVAEQGRKSLGVFSPEQLKSVFNKAPTERPELSLSLRPTNTDAFKRWFGDSKTTDETGRPILVYTGTSKDKDFTKFNIPKNGTWFTADPQSASQYAVDNDSMGLKRDGSAFVAVNTASRVIPVYLRIENPASLSAADMEAMRNATNYKKTQGEIFDRLRAKGHDGVNMGGGVWVVLNSPSQIKSAIGNNGSYDPNSPDMRRSLRSPIGLYSELENKIEAVSAKAAPAPQWKAMINALTQKGVKPEEIEWSGVNDWLDLQQGKVAKDDLLNYLRANGVQVEETVLGGETADRQRADLQDRRDAAANIVFTGTGEVIDGKRIANDDLAYMLLDGGVTPSQLPANKRKAAEEWLDSYKALENFKPKQYAPTKFGASTLPGGEGGENYREVLLTLPGKEPVTVTRFQALTARGELVQTFRNRADAEFLIEGLDGYTVREVQMPGSDNANANLYRSSHWQQPNVLAHIRVNDRTDADGKKVLFVEEIQSDWGQGIKKRGAAGTIEAALKANGMTRAEFDSMPAEDQQFAIDETKRMGLPPQAPFVTKTEGWLNLALKRIIVMAAEGGYDKVAFVNGEQSADRYDLSKAIDSIDVRKIDNGKLMVYANKDNEQVLTKMTRPAELEDVIGKDMARRVLDDIDAGRPTQYRGLDLKTGGEGMRAFYDQIVPIAVKKLLPKVGGGQMEMVEIDDRIPGSEARMNEITDADILEQPGFDVTPAMREKVQTTGLPKFSLRSLVSQALTPGMTATMNKIAPPTYDPNLPEKILNAVHGDTFTNIRQKALNRYERLAEYDRIAADMIKQMGGVQQLADSRAESAALFSDLGAGLLETALGVHDRVGGAPVYRNGMTTISNYGGTVKGPILIFKPLSDLNDKDAYRLYQTWAAVQRGKRLDAEGREQLIDKNDIAQVRAMEQSHPQLTALFKSIQKDWLTYNDALVTFMADTGVITPEMAKEWTKHGDYFPFYRLVDEDVAGPKMFTSIANVKQAKVLKGGEGVLGDFFENIVRNSQAAIQAGIKNVAAQKATKQAVFIQQAVRLQRKESGPNVYRVLEGGKEVFYKSADPLFIEAIKSLNMADLPFMGLLSGPANLLRNLVTKDPAFMLANMMRDSLSAYVTSGVKMTPIVDTIKNFGKVIAGQSPEMERLWAAGLLGGYDYAQGAKTSGKEFQKRLREVSGTKTKFEKFTAPATSVWGALEKGTQASDAATRIEVYKRVLAQTGNEAEAYWQALEVMNFNRKGNSPVVRILTAAVPFLNARMQGLDVLYRTAIAPLVRGNATDEAKQRMMTFWVRGMTMMALSSMYWLMTHDDDDYKKQEQETKDNYWLIPSLGVKIPIPFEVGVMFKVVPERIMALTFGDDTSKDFLDSMKRQLLSTFAFNPIPQVALPIVEARTNHSFFTGRSIVGQGLEGVAPEYQVSPSTSRVAEMIGKAVGYSPIMTDHLIKGYTGAIGQYAADLFDMLYDMNADAPKASKRFEQMPVIKRFAVDPEARGNVTAYYELKNAVDEVVRTTNLLERSMNFNDYGKYMQDNMKMFAFKDYVNDLEKSMKDYREMKQMVMAMPMDSDSKRDAMTSIGRMENALTSNIQTIKKMASD